MHEVPDCLNRRYNALDELIKELNAVSHIDFQDETTACCNDPGVKLMCEFWQILKEDPDCNLKKAVQQRLCPNTNSGMFQPQRISCYMAAHNCMKKEEDEGRLERKPDLTSKVCCHRSPNPSPKLKCCSSKSISPSQPESDVLPLSKVLCNLKEAASFDRKCQGMISELMAAQKQLQDQIQHLEHREKEGVQLLKQADCMWSCMEDAYKKKILESQERQQELIKQLKEADANTNKWRKNKKDLEFQLENINKCHQEIFEKLHQKQNDLKSMNMDIADYKKRIENNKKEIEAAKKSLGTKKRASDDKIKKISSDISRKEAMIRDEKSRKQEKENEGNQYIKEARADLLNLSRILLQKRIENEDMKTEKETLIDELEMLSQTYDQCKDRCQSKKQSIEDEIKIIDKEIANYKAKCATCHQCTDTIDIRKFCTDCPRCLEERDCLFQDDHCNPDHTMDCVCMSVKQKFLDNVFENMYTVLERQIKTGPGKAVAETVLNCLKRSRNGKLDQETRQILQDFILTTVKKNLNLTIVGGAVKTRCELDSDTYKQLMLCLKQVKVVRPPKADKETAAKKDPCRRWGGTSECNCPKGPKACICTKKAPPPPEEPGPCPPPDKEDVGEVKVCPYKESAACGPDCAMHAVPSAVGTDVKAWRPDPCQGPTCTFKNMRAAQCVLGPEVLNAVSSSKSYVTAVPYVPNMTIMDDQESCSCGSTPFKQCSCKNDVKGHPREKIIEEVMGKYFEVTPIDKVSATKEYEIDSKNNEKDVQQTKVNSTKQCDKNTCGVIHKTLHEDDIFIIDPEKNDSYNHSNIYHTPNRYSLKENTIDSNVMENISKEQHKPLLIADSSQNIGKVFINNADPTNHINKSKVSKVDIDERVINMIENITNEYPDQFVSLRRTKSGHLNIGFNSVDDKKDDNIILKRSPSGNMIIEVDQNIIQALKSKERLNDNLKSTQDNKTINSTSNIFKPCNSKCSEIKALTESAVEKYLLQNLKDHFNGCKLKQNRVSIDVFQKWYKEGVKNINVRIKYQNELLISQKASLTQLSSESLAVHVKNPGITNNNKLELPVALYVTSSGIVNIFVYDDAFISDTVATRTVSDGFLIYKKRPINHERQISKQNVTKPKEVIKVKLKGLDNVITEPPAVIKETASGNYDIILEKEFEKSYTQAIKHHKGGETGSYFEIINTPSGIVLDFEKHDRVRSESKKALLMKSHSGLLKIIVSDSTSDTVQKNKSLASGSVISAKVLGDLLKKLPYSGKNSHKLHSPSTKRTKSSSDSGLFKTSKSKLRSRQSIFEESSATLKKTKSGQYTVVLDKESKKSFINNLVTYIDKSMNSVIPIKRTDSGEITIVLNKDLKNIGRCESLKISNSGNIYVMLDENTMKQMSDDVAVNTRKDLKEGESYPYISKLECPKHKAVATNCNANSDDSLCDSSKCVCEISNIKEDSVKDLYLKSSNTDYCGKSVCSRMCVKQSVKPNMSPHIVIKPRESQSTSDKTNGIHASYFCEVQAICPYHKDRYDAVSNELLEISGLCNSAQEKIVSKVGTNSKRPLKSKNTIRSFPNSLDYLPPQLPPFLRNFTYN